MAYMRLVQYEGELTYTPLTETYPAAYYWGINVTSSTYGTHTVIPTSTAGIVDTGTTRMFLSLLKFKFAHEISCTTEVLLADNFFDVYLRAIPGAKAGFEHGSHRDFPFLHLLYAASQLHDC